MGVSFLARNSIPRHPAILPPHCADANMIMIKINSLLPNSHLANLGGLKVVLPPTLEDRLHRLQVPSQVAHSKVLPT